MVYRCERERMMTTHTTKRSARRRASAHARYTLDEQERASTGVCTSLVRTARRPRYHDVQTPTTSTAAKHEASSSSSSFSPRCLTSERERTREQEPSCRTRTTKREAGTRGRGGSRDEAARGRGEAVRACVRARREKQKTKERGARQRAGQHAHAHAHAELAASAANRAGLEG